VSAISQCLSFKPPTTIVFVSPTLFSDNKCFHFAHLVVISNGVAGQMKEEVVIYPSDYRSYTCCSKNI